MTLLPLLAIVYSPRSRPCTEIFASSTDVCRLLWVVDSSVPEGATVAAVAAKFGQVVDTSGRSPQEIVQLVHAEHPDGITSYSDGDLHRQAWLAAALGLPGPSIAATARLTDKLLQRQALQAGGVPIPRFSAINDPVDAQEVERLVEAIGFPQILKPRDGTACRGISAIDDTEQLTRLLGETAEPNRMVLEERMADLPSSGDPYAGRISIDSMVSNGVVSHLGITGLFSMVPPFRSTGGFFPASAKEPEIAEYFGLATASIRALGADFGCYRTEVKLTPEGNKIIEVNGRPTGLTPATVRIATGLPLLEMSMRLALGEHIEFDGPVASTKIGYRYYCEPPMSAERIVAIDGLEKLRDLPGVLKVDVHKGPGDPVDWQNGSLDKIFQVTGAVADYEELAEHYRACTEDVVVTYEHRR